MYEKYPKQYTTWDSIKFIFMFCVYGICFFLFGLWILWILDKIGKKVFGKEKR